MSLVKTYSADRPPSRSNAACNLISHVSGMPDDIPPEAVTFLHGRQGMPVGPPGIPLNRSFQQAPVKLPGSLPATGMAEVQGACFLAQGSKTVQQEGIDLVFGEPGQGPMQFEVKAGQPAAS